TRQQASGTRKVTKIFAWLVAGTSTSSFSRRRKSTHHLVIPAKAGIHLFCTLRFVTILGHPAETSPRCSLAHRAGGGKHSAGTLKHIHVSLALRPSLASERPSKCFPPPALV